MTLMNILMGIHLSDQIPSKEHIVVILVMFFSYYNYTKNTGNISREKVGVAGLQPNTYLHD